MAKATPQHLDDPTEYKDYKPEEAGSAIRVDGKPIKSTSKKDIDPLGEAADNTMKMIARKRATAEEAGKSKMNAMGDTYAKGGTTASKRADGIAQRGKTKGTIVMCGGGMSK
jgi:hypothetical protein